MVRPHENTYHHSKWFVVLSAVSFFIGILLIAGDFTFILHYLELVLFFLTLGLVFGILDVLFICYAHDPGFHHHRTLSRALSLILLPVGLVSGIVATYFLLFVSYLPSLFLYALSLFSFGWAGLHTNFLVTWYKHSPLIKKDHFIFETFLLLIALIVGIVLGYFFL